MAYYSFSTLNTAKFCKYRYYLENEIGLRSRTDINFAMSFGLAFGKGLKAYYMGGTINAMDRAFCDAYPEIDDPGDKARTLETGMDALTEYVRQYDSETSHWKVLELPDAGVLLDGFITHKDLIVEDDRANDIIVVDHKTVGSGDGIYLKTNYWDKYQNDPQINHYVREVQQRYGTCAGFMIDAISFGYRSRGDKRYGEAGPWRRFGRMLYTPNDQLIADEQETTAGWIASIEQSRRSGVWLKNDRQCFRCPFGGGVEVNRGICTNSYRWPRDQELIEEHYRLICNQLTGNLRPCMLDPGHEGQHNDQPPPPEVPLEASVELEEEGVTD